MKLIDKDALKKDILDLQNCYNGFSDTYDKACIIGVIDEQPTIEERKVGKWIDGQCSICGCDIPAYIIDWKWQKDMDANFCPNCGTRMESEK